MNKRICHISTVHRREDARIFLKECASLASHFSNVSLLVFDGHGHEEKQGVNIEDIGSPPRNRLKRMIVGSFRVLRNPTARAAEIVHFHDPELLLVGILLKRQGKAVIYDAHEDVPRQIEHKHWIPARLRRIVGAVVERVENFVASRLSAVVAATPLIQQRFLRVNAMATTVRNYPLLEEFLNIPLQKPLSRNVCYVGALTRERGILELLDALVELTDVTLLACGPFQSIEFEAELRRHRGWRHVEYLGIIGRKEVAKVIGRSQVGLVTLLPSPNQIESLPVKMFEYMACGTPFLASDFPLWRSIMSASNGGRCVDPSDFKKIASVLKDMLNDPSELQAMGIAGRSAAMREFNWRSEAENLINLYINILKNEKKSDK